MSEGLLTISPMASEDIPRIMEIEKQCFQGDDSWTADGFQRELDNKKIAFYITASLDGKIIGYMGSWIILEEAHITTFAVDPEYRNRKVASTLMLCFLREAVKQEVHWSTLEVNENNEHAIKLYKRFGYKTVNVRKNYYGENEDAFLMWLGNMHLKSFSDRLDVIEQEIS